MSCPHDIYNAWGCQQCNPNPETGPSPILPRSSSDPLSDSRTEKLDTCTACGNLRTYFDEVCQNPECGKPFPVDDIAGRVQLAANAHYSGNCPACGSAVHYEKSASKWECADCGEVYTAPKRRDR